MTTQYLELIQVKLFALMRFHCVCASSLGYGVCLAAYSCCGSLKLIEFQFFLDLLTC